MPSKRRGWKPNASYHYASMSPDNRVNFAIQRINAILGWFDELFS